MFTELLTGSLIEAFWSHFDRIGTRHFGKKIANSVRIGIMDLLVMSKLNVMGSPLSRPRGGSIGLIRSHQRTAGAATTMTTVKIEV